MQIKDKYFWCNIALGIGVLSLIGLSDYLLLSLGIYGRGASYQMFDSGIPGYEYGWIIILGAILYKAAKKQKICPSKVWLIVEIVSAIALIYQFVPFSSSGYIGPDNTLTSFFVWPLVQIWNLATQQGVTLEYKVPAVISLIALVWTLIIYFYIKLKKVVS